MRELQLSQAEDLMNIGPFTKQQAIMLAAWYRGFNTAEIAGFLGMEEHHVDVELRHLRGVIRVLTGAALRQRTGAQTGGWPWLAV